MVSGPAPEAQGAIISHAETAGIAQLNSRSASSTEADAAASGTGLLLRPMWDRRILAVRRPPASKRADPLVDDGAAL